MQEIEIFYMNIDILLYAMLHFLVTFNFRKKLFNMKKKLFDFIM